MKINKLSDFTKHIDITSLNNCITYSDLKKICNNAKQNEVNSIIVNSGQVKFCVDYLENSEVKVGAAISFPHGQVSIPTKAFETEDAISNGAKEIEYIPNLTELKAGHDEFVQTEMNIIWDLCQTWDIVGKVVINSNNLSQNEIEQIAKIALKVKLNYIKISSEYSFDNKQLENVKLLKHLIGDKIKIEVGNQINSFKQAILLLEAGVDRISTANETIIVEEARTKIDKY